MQTTESTNANDRRGGGARALLWLSVAVGAFFAVRAVTTLAAGADFGAPGTGWRSIWQLTIVAVLVGGVAWPSRRRAAVALVGVVYALASLIELATPNDLFGVIPVDMRDHVVHPLVALLAFGAVALSARRVPVDVRATPAS